jgi:hypothetical protein
VGKLGAERPLRATGTRRREQNRIGACLIGQRDAPSNVRVAKTQVDEHCDPGQLHSGGNC